MIRNKLVIIFILLTILTLPIKQTTAAEGIKLTKIKGDLYYKSQGWWIFSGKWQELTTEVRLETGDKIKTNQNSKAEITWAKQARVLIKSNSKLQITKNEQGKVDLKRLKLDLGEVLVKFINQFGGQFEIETPSAVAGVKGTTFKVVVSEQKETRVAVNEGQVEVTNEAGKVSVTKGKAAQVIDQKSQPTLKDNPGQSNKDQAWVKKIKQWSQDVKQKMKKQKKKHQKSKKPTNQKKSDNNKRQNKEEPPKEKETENQSSAKDKKEDKDSANENKQNNSKKEKGAANKENKNQGKGK